MISREIKRRANQFLIPGLSVCLMVYFMYHLIQGGRGILALKNLESLKIQHQEKLDSLRHTQDKLSKKVSMLKPGSLSVDLLEERAKEVLGYSHQNEQIVFVDDVVQSAQANAHP